MLHDPDLQYKQSIVLILCFMLIVAGLVLGWNVTVGGEAEVGLHFGGSIGKRTAIHLGPFSGVITIGSAK